MPESRKAKLSRSAVPKSRFGELFQTYLDSRDLTREQLQPLLSDCGYKVSVSLLYKSGYKYSKEPEHKDRHRHPSPALIYNIALCLGLTSEQLSALLDVRIADFFDEFLEEFIDGLQHTVNTRTGGGE